MTSSSGFWAACVQCRWKAVSTACAVSQSSRGPYHRHCGCALHFLPHHSPTFSQPSCITMRRSGMFRSLSLENLEEKASSACVRGLCGACNDRDLSIEYTHSSSVPSEGAESPGDDRNRILELMWELFAILICEIALRGQLSVETRRQVDNESKLLNLWGEGREVMPSRKLVSSSRGIIPAGSSSPNSAGPLRPAASPVRQLSSVVPQRLGDGGRDRLQLPRLVAGAGGRSKLSRAILRQ